MDISVIIVSYNCAEVIAPCLLSVLAAQEGNSEIFVVDNNSTDGTVTLVREGFPSVYLLPNEKNIGFGAANNQVLQNCLGRYIFFLNPDTEIPSGIFSCVTEYMDAHPEVGLAGLRIINPDGSHQESVSYRYPGEKYSRGELGVLGGTIACVLGAGMIARTNLIRDLGGFDENFFLYGEDQDLCLRIRKRGFLIGYIEDTCIVHVGGHSERSTPSKILWQKKILAENIFYRKYYRPDTIWRIKCSELIKALWRLATLCLTVHFALDRAREHAKRDKYRLIREDCLAFFKKSSM